MARAQQSSEEEDGGESVTVSESEDEGHREPLSQARTHHSADIEQTAFPIYAKVSKIRNNMPPAIPQRSKTTGLSKSREIRKDVSFSSHSEDSQMQQSLNRTDKPPSYPQHGNNSNQRRYKNSGPTVEVITHQDSNEHTSEEEEYTTVTASEDEEHRQPFHNTRTSIEQRTTIPTRSESDNIQPALQRDNTSSLQSRKEVSFSSHSSRDSQTRAANRSQVSSDFGINIASSSHHSQLVQSIHSPATSVLLSEGSRGGRLEERGESRDGIPIEVEVEHEGEPEPLPFPTLPVYSLNKTTELTSGDKTYFLTRKGPDGSEEHFTATVLTPSPSPPKHCLKRQRSLSIPSIGTPPLTSTPIRPAISAHAGISSDHEIHTPNRPSVEQTDTGFVSTRKTKVSREPSSYTVSTQTENESQRKKSKFIMHTCTCVHTICLIMFRY